jgi:hypothetical protein
VAARLPADGIGIAVYLVVSTWQVWLLFFTALIVAVGVLPAGRRLGNRSPPRPGR